MNAYANVSLIENKLDELLSENHLVHTFRTSSYPVVLTTPRMPARRRK